jgi:hypothetical protein
LLDVAASRNLDQRQLWQRNATVQMLGGVWIVSPVLEDVQSGRVGIVFMSLTLRLLVTRGELELMP